MKKQSERVSICLDIPSLDIANKTIMMAKDMIKATEKYYEINSVNFNKIVPSYWLDVLLPNEIKFKPFPMISSTVLEDLKKVMSDAVNPSNFFSIDSIIEKDANLNIKDVLESKKKIYERSKGIKNEIIC